MASVPFSWLLAKHFRDEERKSSARRACPGSLLLIEKRREKRAINPALLRGIPKIVGLAGSADWASRRQNSRAEARRRRADNEDISQSKQGFDLTNAVCRPIAG